jgi:hypothetical protein
MYFLRKITVFVKPIKGEVDPCRPEGRRVEPAVYPEEAHG